MSYLRASYRVDSVTDGYSPLLSGVSQVLPFGTFFPELLIRRSHVRRRGLGIQITSRFLWILGGFCFQESKKRERGEGNVMIKPDINRASYFLPKNWKKGRLFPALHSTHSTYRMAFRVRIAMCNSAAMLQTCLSKQIRGDRMEIINHIAY